MNIPGPKLSSYTAINRATATDSVFYDVVRSNACGNEISCPATLTVHTFSLNPTNQNFHHRRQSRHIERNFYGKL